MLSNDEAQSVMKRTPILQFSFPHHFLFTWLKLHIWRNIARKWNYMERYCKWILRPPTQVALILDFSLPCPQRQQKWLFLTIISQQTRWQIHGIIMAQTSFHQSPAHEDKSCLWQFASSLIFPHDLEQEQCICQLCWKKSNTRSLLQPILLDVFN